MPAEWRSAFICAGEIGVAILTGVGSYFATEHFVSAGDGLAFL